MEYREMKMKSGTERPSLLGFGCLRFPKGEDARIDEALVAGMFKEAFAAGVNYIDTAYPYDDGANEPVVGRILKKYPRERFFLATKLPVWKVESVEDADRIFCEQLERLQVDYVDFYLFHALSRERFEKVIKLGLLPWAEGLTRQGRIRYLGFSFHDSYEAFEEILTYRKWDFAQIQYNYMDTDFQAGDKGYALAQRMGVPLVVMEPVKGGTLAALPGALGNPLKEVLPSASYASWALRWVAGHENVKVVLSGMSSPGDVADNLHTFDPYVPLNPREEALIGAVAAEIKKRVRNGCTGCAYCMPCPFGVNIPANFRRWNEYGMFENVRVSKRAYGVLLAPKERADQCRKCGRCEKECPQHLPIRRDLARAAVELGALINE